MYAILSRISIICAYNDLEYNWVLQWLTILLPISLIRKYVMDSNAKIYEAGSNYYVADSLVRLYMLWQLIVNLSYKIVKLK